MGYQLYFYPSTFGVDPFLALCATISFAQSQGDESEKARPMRDIKVVRNVTEIDIEGKLYEDVEVTMKSISADYLIFNNDRVKVTLGIKMEKRFGKRHFITHICMFSVTVKYK